MNILVMFHVELISEYFGDISRRVDKRYLLIFFVFKFIHSLVYFIVTLSKLYFNCL